MGGVRARHGIVVEAGRSGVTMIPLVRKFMWWLQRRRKEDELREELQFHLSEEAGERRADGLPEDQATWAARRDLGNVTLLQEEHAHAVVVDPARAAGARRSLRPAGDGQEPSVYGPRRTVACARDRRQHRDLQLHGLDSDALAAGVGSGVVGRGEVAQRPGQLQSERFRVAFHRRQHLPRPFGHHSRYLSVSSIRAPAGGIDAGPVEPVRAQTCRPA